MTQNELVTFGESAEKGCGFKFAIYFKNVSNGQNNHGLAIGTQRRKRRYFLRQTQEGANQSTEIRITSAQVEECQNLPGEGMELVRARCAWAMIAIATGKRPQGIKFTARMPHGETLA